MEIMSWKDYLDALEEEQRKIEVFRRELPLVFNLITQVIENYKHQMESQILVGGMGCEDGHVMADLMPMKGGFVEEEGDESERQQEDCTANVEGEQMSAEEEEGRSDGKVNWLSSMQLWIRNQEDDQNRQAAKAITIDGERRGAFRPFSRQKCPTEKDVASSMPPSPPPEQREQVAMVAESSTAETGGGEGCDSSGQVNGEEQKKGQSRRKKRRCWSPELHRRFVQALQQLGGAQSATPKQIRELMNVDGLTSDEVKSHLQKYRIHTSRRSAAIPVISGGLQAPQFILVGGIWMPPLEYAATTITPSPEADGKTLQKLVYTPVALSSTQQNTSQTKQPQTFTTVPLRDARHAEGNDEKSSSPVISSSSHCTSTHS